MKTSRIFLTIIMLTLTILVFTGCQGVVPTPSPGVTEDPTIIIGKIKMPWACCAIGEEPIEDEPIGHYTDGWSIIPDAIVEIRDVNNCNKLLYSTIADENGYYEFKDIKPGHYIITAICPVEENYILKDVAEKKEGIALNAGIPDCDSTALALVIEYIKGCFEDYSCFPKRDNSEVYKQVGKVVSIINRKNIPLIIEGYANIWNLKDKDLEEFDKLVELVCDRLMACCIGPGTTPIRPQPDPGPTPNPCATNSPPKNIQLKPQSATVGEEYIGTVTADDADGDDLTFDFHADFTPPGDMQIEKTGRYQAKITWNPTEDDICNCEEPRSADLARTVALPQACDLLRIIVSDICHPEGVEEVFCLEVQPAAYTVTFYGCDGETVFATEVVDFGALIPDPGDPTGTGFNFAGWYEENTFINLWDLSSDTMPAHDLDLYAKCEALEGTVSGKICNHNGQGYGDDTWVYFRNADTDEIHSAQGSDKGGKKGYYSINLPSGEYVLWAEVQKTKHWESSIGYAPSGNPVQSPNGWICVTVTPAGIYVVDIWIDNTKNHDERPIPPEGTCQ